MIMKMATLGAGHLDVGGVEESKLQEPESALWNDPLMLPNAQTLAARIKAGAAAAR
jgi:hypothetical protein